MLVTLKKTLYVGYEQSVKQWCPIPLLGAFTYNHTDGATTTCSGNSGLSVCPSWTTMKFDYMKCSTVQAFSSKFILMLGSRTKTLPVLKVTDADLFSL